MTIPTGVVTLGGVTVGLGILAWTLTRWWLKDRPKWMTLLPFTAAALYGMLLILATGGLLGGAAGIALWGSSELGDAALKYGVGGGTPSVQRSSPLHLTDGGHALVLVLTVVAVAVWKYSKKLPRKDVGLGILCGVCLGLSSGIAGMAADLLAPAVSVGGDAIVGLL